MNRIAIYLLVFVAWSAAMFGAGWAWRVDRADGTESDQRAAGAEAVKDQVNQVRDTEHQQAEALATIGAKHEEDRAAATAIPAAVAAGVRDGSLQLRDDLATCNTARLQEQTVRRAVTLARQDRVADTTSGTGPQSRAMRSNWNVRRKVG
ncbi:hypothetical protein [Stenotrophomonas geniculata]|uniref:hypothetical protein n=1 Tax=Stenotrophomonas geniculata TaxID=86188 RepID=UPI00029ABC88|nr:hypothetical protein [Stenotrophomonas geniculata]